MAIAIGFRVEGMIIHWAIIRKTDVAFVIEAADKYKPPIAGGEASVLSHVRGRVGLLLDEYTPARGGIKYTEPNAKGRGDSVRRRARIEGVILQLLDERGVQTLGGAYNTIGPRLRLEKPKTYLAHDEFRGVVWADLPDHQREAILAALAALAE